MQLADNVPQRNVDPRDGRRANNSLTVPEVLPPHHLPQMLDARRVLADQQLRQILNRSHNTARMPFQRRFTPAEQPRLIGDDLDEHPVAHPGVADERFDAGDFHEWWSFDRVNCALIIDSTLRDVVANNKHVDRTVTGGQTISDELA